MNNSQSYPELDSLIALLMEDRLDESHFQRLKELLAESDQACLRYIEAMHLKVELSEWAQEHDGALRVFVEE